MNDDMLHVPSGRAFNLYAADAGDDGRDIVEGSYRRVKRGEFLCLKHGSAVYLQKRHGHFWAIHFEGHHADHGPPPGMSDEHKRQTEYVVRAAEDAGFTTDTEVVLPGVRPDAVITGPTVSIGVEIQRSGLTASAAVARTRKQINAGLFTSAWFNDKPQDRQPPWAFKVPTVGMNLMRWEAVPPRHAVAVSTGVRRIVAKRCDGASCSWGRRGRRACGGYHPVHEAHLTEAANKNRSTNRDQRTTDYALSVDQVATMLPAGQLVPFRFRGKEVLLVPPESVALYENLTGKPVELVFNPLAASVIGDVSGDPGLHPCAAELPVLPALATVINGRRFGQPCPQCGTQALWAPNSILRGYCEACRLGNKWGREDDKRGLEARRMGER